MILEIKITEISILDKKILAQALNEFGGYCQQLYIKNSDEKGHLMQYSIAQNTLHNLTQLFNTSKVLRMTIIEQYEPSKGQRLLMHSALVSINALQHYQDQSEDPYIRSRCDVLWNKMSRQII